MAEEVDPQLQAWCPKGFRSSNYWIFFLTLYLFGTPGASYSLSLLPGELTCLLSLFPKLIMYLPVWTLKVVFICQSVAL